MRSIETLKETMQRGILKEFEYDSRIKVFIRTLFGLLSLIRFLLRQSFTMQFEKLTLKCRK